MELRFTVKTKINKSVEDVFDAIVNPDKICGYFTDNVSGPPVEGEEMTWSWDAYGDHPVSVKQVIPGKQIAIEWQAHRDDYTTQATLSVEADGDKNALLKIEESGWKSDEKGLQSSYDNCSGWQHMALCMKAYLEHGIDLRK